MLFERPWWARFKGIYLVRFGFRMWEILIFKWFLKLKIQIKTQVLEGKISWGRGNTGHTSSYCDHIYTFFRSFKLQDSPAELWRHFTWDICVVMITLMFFFDWTLKMEYFLASWTIIVGTWSHLKMSLLKDLSKERSINLCKMRSLLKDLSKERSMNLCKMRCY